MTNFECRVFRPPDQTPGSLTAGALGLVRPIRPGPAYGGVQLIPALMQSEVLSTAFVIAVPSVVAATARLTPITARNKAYSPPATPASSAQNGFRTSSRRRRNSGYLLIGLPGRPMIRVSLPTPPIRVGRNQSNERRSTRTKRGLGSLRTCGFGPRRLTLSTDQFGSAVNCDRVKATESALPKAYQRTQANWLLANDCSADSPLDVSTGLGGGGSPG
jgi:hypothetical protein